MSDANRPRTGGESQPLGEPTPRLVQPGRGRESAALKARRYLVEGRLLVLEVRPDLIRATCRGDGQVYRLGWWRGRWGCTCPAAGTFRADCAHLLALRLVVVEPAGRAASSEPLTAARLRAEQDEASRVRAGVGRRSA